MEKDFYISLIYKELKGELSDSEVETLQAFYKESEDNRTLRDEIQLSWMLSQANGEVVDLDIDVDADLGKVKNTLGHGSTTIEKETKVVPMWRRLASIAAILIPLIGIGIYFLQNNNRITTYAATDSKKEIQLEDGTSIWLNRNSELEVAANFNGTERKVKLSGEAFFDVAKNQEKPFIIDAGDINVTVLGTSFNVIEHTGVKIVSVFSGKVKVANKVNTVILEKNEKAVYTSSTQDLSKEVLLNKNDIAWKTGIFTYKNESLDSIVKQLEYLFSARIEIENKALLNCKISLVSNETDLESIINKISNAVNAEFKQVDDRAYRLTGGSCK